MVWLLILFWFFVVGVLGVLCCCWWLGHRSAPGLFFVATATLGQDFHLLYSTPPSQQTRPRTKTKLQDVSTVALIITIYYYQWLLCPHHSHASRHSGHNQAHAGRRLCSGAEEQGWQQAVGKEHTAHRRGRMAAPSSQSCARCWDSRGSPGWVQGWSEGWMALLTRPWLSGCCGFSRSCHAPPPCLVFAGGQELSHGQAKRGEGSGEEKGQAR